MVCEHRVRHFLNRYEFMTSNTDAFDQWIRDAFVELNTELEEIYFAQDDRAAVGEAGADIRDKLVEEGRGFIAALLEEGNTDEGFENGFDLLGNVGLYMAACRRHDVTEPSRERTSPLIEASALALQLGSSLGVTPRFATSHLSTQNLAINGSYKCFTSLEAERMFLEFNTRSIFAFKRAADALVRTLPLGVSHPVTYDLLVVANDAIHDVLTFNDEMFEKLSTDRFFYCVRPYYKPYRVGLHEYRGANAGDFAGINELDLLLGLCHADSPSYSQLLVDKFLYMMPEDQQRLRDCMRRRSLLRDFLDHIDEHASSPWFQKNASMFLNVCDAHGATAKQHHDQLVSRFIEKPSQDIDESYLQKITASGPPLDVLLRSLEKLRDQRMAADRDDIQSSYHELRRLRASVQS